MREAHTPGQVQRRRAKRGDERLGKAVEEDRIIESSVSLNTLFPPLGNPLEFVEEIAMGGSMGNLQQRGDEEAEDFNRHLTNVGASSERI